MCEYFICVAIIIIIMVQKDLDKVKVRETIKLYVDRLL